MSAIFTAMIGVAATLVQPSVDERAALRIAEAVAQFDGYTRSSVRGVELELTDPPGRAVYRGFLTVQIRVNGQSAFDLSINRRTGQVLEFTRCLMFDYPIIRTVERKQRLHLAAPISVRKMMGDNGCDTYRVLHRRGDEARDLKAWRTD